MRKIILTLLLFTGTLFVSCDTDSTANVSKITNYPIITVLGDSEILVPQGETFVDPGVVAVEGDNEISTTASVTGLYRGGSSVDTNVIDTYQIIYSAKNADGFPASAVRYVQVYNNGDLINNIEGLYTSTVTRNGTLTAQYTDMEYVLVWKNSDGTYQMSDGIGGYYDLGRGFGPGYAGGPTIITANDIATNDFSVPNFPVGDFGGDAEMTSLTVNPDNSTITYSTIWDAGDDTIYTFEVTLTQVQP